MIVLNKKKDYVSSLANLNFMVQALKYTVITLLITVIVLFICLIKTINRQQLFLGIDDSGIPVPLKIIDNHAINLINYQQFLIDFLSRAYCWTPETFQTQIYSAYPLLDDQAKIFFEKELKKNKTYELVSQQSITNMLVVRYIDINSIRPTDEGWLINVDAVKLRLIEMKDSQGIFSSKPIPVKFTIGFKTCSLTPENIWGFKVYYLNEEEILS